MQVLLSGELMLDFIWKGGAEDLVTIFVNLRTPREIPTSK